MEESHREGLANHPDPESCVASRRAAIEALTGAIMRKMVNWILDGILTCSPNSPAIFQTQQPECLIGGRDASKSRIEPAGGLRGVSRYGSGRRITTYPVHVSGPLEGKQIHVGRVALHECQSCRHLMPTPAGQAKVDRSFIPQEAARQES